MKHRGETGRSDVAPPVLRIHRDEQLVIDDAKSSDPESIAVTPGAKEASSIG